ncbi:hypothetical protein Val02_52800 [Virgisporangium aliadipatigenens]|uniref:Secreted protein n=1 Tax=Virgisporangium aliadipatigenens TaxID=741659 RepID=A0A8J3YMS6_9ACTN|nr:hypothetical protein [Virgisporangium aliadipatigenens]GIJ48394.1 hypothetical protein Val02_52800 [Virgisporangium aliadipatigenens]
MRKALTVAACAAAFLMAAPATAGHAADTTPSPSSASPYDAVIGTGTLGQFGTPTAYLGATGTRIGDLGAYTITYPDGTYAIGSITCVAVESNVAYVTGRVALSGGPRKTTNNWNKGTFIVIGVEDNGNGGATEAPDRLNFSKGLATDPGCAPNLLARPDFQIVKGNYWVRDGG